MVSLSSRPFAPDPLAGNCSRAEVPEARGTGRLPWRGGRGDRGRPRLVVTATLEETADLAALRQRIGTEALTHARDGLDNDPPSPFSWTGR